MMSNSLNGFPSQQQHLQNPLRLSEERLNSAVSGSTSQVNQFLMPDSAFSWSSLDLRGGTPPAIDGGDWRSQLPPDGRQRIVDKILGTLQRHVPVSGEEGLQEVRKIAVIFEGKIYNAATSQSDYLRKISLTMLRVESRSQTSSASSSLIPSPTTWAPGSGGKRQQELERMADKIEQDMQAAVKSQHDYTQKMNLLKEALDEFRSQNTLHNTLPPNSTDVSKDPWEPDSNDGTPPQIPDQPPETEGGDWRVQLQSNSRQKIVNKISETLKRHLPVVGEDGLNEIKNVASRFEEKIYSSATSRSDYLQRISLKMLTMESQSQNTPPVASP